MNTVQSVSSHLKTKHHFQILDGLRGVAAVAVVIFHFMEIVVPDYHNSFIAHAYLSVDFFFCLSGFVIAYAYDDKLRIIGKLTFIKLRLIRLHPLVLIGSIIGLISYLADPYLKLYTSYGLKQTILLFLSSSLLIPYPLVHERYFNLFHLNPPTWSLFWEYIANSIYALILYKIHNRALFVLTIIAALALIYEAHLARFLGVGWGGDNVPGGAVRVFYSFLAGILLSRSKWIIRSPLGFASMSCLLMAAFLVPFSSKINFITDPALVILYLPLLVALGAGAHLTPKFSAICKFSGNISYPLYMIHYPFIWLFQSYVEKKKPAVSQLAIIIPTSALLLIGLAYLVMIFLDTPIRTYLRDKFIKKVI